MPYIETALIGDENESNINHYGAVRLRVTGHGYLDMKIVGLDNSESVTLMPLAISNNGRELDRLSNFKGQRASLRIETDMINEIFEISRVILFIKPLYTSYPGNV